MEQNNKYDYEQKHQIWLALLNSTGKLACLAYVLQGFLETIKWLWEIDEA